MIVADAGPVIIFARIRQLDLLGRVTGGVLVPGAVYEEVLIKGQGGAGAQQLAQSGWFHRSEVNDSSLLTGLPGSLHAGEREAIVLARQLDAQLLMDERRGRGVAKALGIDVIGSLTVLAEAKKRGLIGLAGPLVTAMIAAGHWIDADLVRMFLAEMGEGEDTPQG